MGDTMSRRADGVFISYRRAISRSTAELVYGSLRPRFDTFLDQRSLGSGRFEPAILDQIAARRHFVVIIEPGTLERVDADDWICREIAHALATKRNVVPLVWGTEWPDAPLPDCISDLAAHNAVFVPSGYYDEAIDRLYGRFLSSPTPGPPHSPTDAARDPLEIAVELVHSGVSFGDAVKRTGVSARVLQIELRSRAQPRPALSERPPPVKPSTSTGGMSTTERLLLAEVTKHGEREPGTDPRPVSAIR